MRTPTRIVTAGRHPEEHFGVVNTPVYRTSTILSASLSEWRSKAQARANDVPGVYYGRNGTPTTLSLETAFAELEGGHRAYVFPSGLAACSAAVMAFVGHGDHVLLPEAVYPPMRRLAQNVLARYGVDVSYYPATAGSGIADLMRPNTRLVYLESPGSNSFEMQDVPAIAAAARRKGAVVAMDNTWATPVYFRPLDHGVDVSIQAATKYVVGHSDAMLGIVTVNSERHAQLKAHTHDLGQIASPDDIYLALRGLRTMHVRLERHWQTGLLLARWLKEQPEVIRVHHPALETDPGHALWKRDYLGASGLFAITLAAVGEAAFERLIDGMSLFGIGASWGGYESLVLPVGVSPITDRLGEAPLKLRFHAGLEAPEDLIDDLSGAFSRMRQIP